MIAALSASAFLCHSWARSDETAALGLQRPVAPFSDCRYSCPNSQPKFVMSAREVCPNWQEARRAPSARIPLVDASLHAHKCDACVAGARSSSMLGSLQTQSSTETDARARLAQLGAGAHCAGCPRWAHTTHICTGTGLPPWRPKLGRTLSCACVDTRAARAALRLAWPGQARCAVAAPSTLSPTRTHAHSVPSGSLPRFPAPTTTTPTTPLPHPTPLKRT